MTDDQVLLYTIAEILLEVNLPAEKKQRLADAMCGVYVPALEVQAKSKSKRFEVPAISDVLAHMESLQVINSYENTEKHLNPRFLAKMMGFPENWTELPFLNGEWNQT